MKIIFLQEMCQGNPECSIWSHHRLFCSFLSFSVSVWVIECHVSYLVIEETYWQRIQGGRGRRSYWALQPLFKLQRFQRRWLHSKFEFAVISHHHHLTSFFFGCSSPNWIQLTHDSWFARWSCCSLLSPVSRITGLLPPSSSSEDDVVKVNCKSGSRSSNLGG